MPRIANLVFLSLFSLSPSLLAQDASKLVLQTAPESTEIPLKELVVIGSHGTATVTPVDNNVCQSAGSCDGVSAEVAAFDSPSEQNRTITLDEGASFELSWRSSGAAAGQAAGDFQPWFSKGTIVPDSGDATSVRRTLSTNNAAASSPYELTLQCSNGTVSSTIDASSKLNLVVNEVVAPSPMSCEGYELISGWIRLTTGSLSCLVGEPSADCRAWNPNLCANSFFGSSGISKKIVTSVSSQRQYVAIGSDTNGMLASASGSFDFERAAGFVTRPPVPMTISKYLGDFNFQQVTGCFFSGNLFSASWRGPNASGTASYILEPNSLCYLIILATSSVETFRRVQLSQTPIVRRIAEYLLLRTNLSVKGKI